MKYSHNNSSKNRDTASKLLVLICMCTISLTWITTTTQADTLEYDIRIGSGMDDAEEQNSNGNISFDSSDLELINDALDHGGDQTIGLRFNNIPVTPGALISNAVIQFTVDENVNVNPCDLIIKAQAVDSALPFSSTAGDITDRLLTSANAAWSPVDWNSVGDYGLDQTTPNIAAVIQEVIDRPGWVSGNSIVLIISGTGRRTAESYNGNPTQAPLLHLEVSPNTLSVNITSPENGSIFDAGDNVTIQADASTPAPATVTKVEFFEGTNLLGQDLSSPYNFIWNAVPEGTYLLTAVATDSNNVSKTSALVTINVVKHPPAVSITSPTNSSSFDIGDTVTIQADASDIDGTVTNVEFFEGTNKLGEDNMAPYSYNWTNVQQGNYSLTAKATDNDSLEGTSDPVTIYVVDSPPAVSITSPENGSIFDTGDDVIIQADASDTDGTITKVEFYEGPIKLGEDTTAPYSFIWNTDFEADYVLTAKATDSGGLSNTSSPVSITVLSMINMEEFAILFSYWGQTGCDTCGGADYSGDNNVDIEDLAYLAEYWLTQPPAQHGPFTVLINEFMADNDDTIADPQNQYDDWIEIYNYGTEAVDLSGMYLTDDLTDTTKWQFPPDTNIGIGGYLLVWADSDQGDTPGLHTNFSLSLNGEEIGLYNTDGVTLIDSISFGDQYEDISYGRYTDGTENWYYMDAPTPLAANTAAMSEKVYFSRLGGVITAPFVLKLSTQSNTGQIRYTTNDAEPTISSTLYDDEVGISVNNTSSSRIRARSFQAGLAPGPVSTEAYLAISSGIQNYSSNIPIIVIDTFGEPIILDSNTKPWAYGYSAFFTPGSDGLTRLTDIPDHVGKNAIRHRGNSSYGMGGYRFEIQNQFGDDEDVPLLGLPAESDWILHRLHYDESNMRDPLAFQWSNEAGLYAPRTQYFNLFLNTGTGQISSNQGLYALTEYIKVGKDRVDIPNLTPTDTYADITGGYIIKKDVPDSGDVTVNGYILHDPDGDVITADQTSWLQNWFAGPKPINPDSFRIYYYLVELFKPIDIFNASTFYNIDGQGKFSIGPVWDFNLSSGNSVASPPLTGWYGTNGFVSTSDLPYLDLWFKLRETVFDTDKMLADINYWADYIGQSPEANLVNWFSNRQNWIDDNIGIKPPVINISGTPMDLGGHISSGDSLTFSGYSGTLYYTTDGSDPRNPATGNPVGTAYSGAVTLTKSTKIRARSLNTGDWSALNEATFSIGPIVDNLRITELMYHPIDPNDEFIELKNIGASSVNLAWCQFTDGVEFTFPDFTLAAGDYALVVRNQSEFIKHYPSAAARLVGEYTGDALSNGGEEIVLTDAAGTEIHDFDYNDWYPVTDGHNFSLCIIDPAGTDLNAWDKKDGWQPSRDNGGSPGSANPANVATNGAIVINEVLTHTDDLVYGDWIELHNTTDAPVNIGGWFLSDDMDDLRKYEIAPGISVSAGGYTVFTSVANFRNTSDKGSHVQFGLSELGENVFLSSGSGAYGGHLAGGYSITENFGASARNVTFGRYVKSAASGYDVDFVSMAGATKEAANSSSPLVPEVVISEIMYNSYNDHDELAEYIELYNRGGSTVPLYDPANPSNTWKFTNGVDYTFPAMITMTPSEYILIVRTDPDIFRYVHSIPPAVDIYGPYEGALDNDGEKLELSIPGTPELSGYVPYIRLEQINYSDGSHPLGSDPWPADADGSGSSLTRSAPSGYGNDVANWNPATPTPGQ